MPSLPKAEQVVLAQRAASGDHEAIETLYNYATPYARRLFIRREVDSDFIDDAIQDAWLLLLRDIGKYDGRADFVSYLLKLAFWKLSRYHRPTKHVTVSLDEAMDAAAGVVAKNIDISVEPSAYDTTFEEGELYRLFEGELAKLTDWERSVFLEDKVDHPHYDSVIGRLRSVLTGIEWVAPQTKPRKMQYRARKRVFTPEMVKEVRQRLMTEPPEVILAEFGLTRGTLANIIFGQFKAA